MEDNRVKIKYHQGYDPTLNEKLTAVAVALGGEFSDTPLGDGTREMSFNFENDENLCKFFRIWKGLRAEKEEEQDKNGEDVNNEQVAQCEQAIKEILPLVERFRKEGQDRRVLLSAVVGLENRAVKLGLMQTLRAARTRRKRGPSPERNDRGGTRYGYDLRRFFSQKVLGDEVFQVGLNDGDRMAELLGPMIRVCLAAFNLSSAPPDLRPGLEQTAERLVFLGLHTHCICFRSPYRFRCDDIVGLERLYDDWCIKSVSTFSLGRDYNKHNRGYPGFVFNTVFDNQVGPIQKQLGLGWWRRMRNRAKFEHLFWTGVKLGILYDLKAKELADQETGQSSVAQPSMPTQRQTLQSQPSETRPPEQVGVPRQKTSTEQEAAALFAVSMLRETQHAWPAVYSNLKESREEKFVVEDESMAAFDLGLAAIAQDLQAVKNLFPMEQADRIEKWVLTWVLKCFDTNDWGDYAVDEVKQYGADFQKESRIAAEFALGTIPGRLLHRWLGKCIKNFEEEIGGEKTGFIDTMLMAQVTNQVIGFSGIWKRFKDDFDLVEGDPKYTLTKTKIWENMDKTDRIMMDQSLTDAERAAAINQLSKD